MGDASDNDQRIKVSRSRWPLRSLSVLLALIGAILTGGGAYLAILGGSFYYVIAGLVILGSALLIWRGDRRGAWLFGAMLAGTLAWSLWEVGLDFWALLPRLAGPFVVGLLFLLAPVQRRFHAIPSAIRRKPMLILAPIIPLVLLAAGIKQTNYYHQAAAPPILSRVNGLRDATAGAMPDEDWGSYGRSQGGTRFSPLTSITPENVGRLEVAWTFRVGMLPPVPAPLFEATPIKIDDTLYLCRPDNKVFALDAETGKARWSYDPKTDSRGKPIIPCRGVAFYRNPAAAAGSECASRILTNTIDARLIAVDAATGRPCSTFGKNGIIDLKEGAGPDPRGYYAVTSAPTIVRGKVVVGSFVLDNQFVGEPSGVVRAFDAVTGHLAWAWDLGRIGPAAVLKPGERYTPGTPNVWAPASADEKLGLVYLPTGNATPDFWGAFRTPEMDRYASSVVALDAGTGQVRWSFQTTHHDVWDYDVASQPTLIDLPIGGHIVPALIQPTKRGETFVLDRRTGRPLSPVVERPVPQGPAPGEWLSPTQPYPARMPSMAGPQLTEAMMWGMTPLDQLWCRIRFREARYDGAFTPPGLKPFIAYPGYGGGSSWGSVSVDPERLVMVINTLRFAHYSRLISRAEADRRGMKLFVGASMGKNPEAALGKPQFGTPYALDSVPFMSFLGMPCPQPPYSIIAAVDLREQRVLWSRPLGTARNSGPLGLETGLPIPLGTPNQGGSVITRSGLVFIGATQERSVRAFELATGKLVWSAKLPAGANATPMLYRSKASGREFLVVAAGGNALLNSKAADYLIAYALPAK